VSTAPRDNGVNTLNKPLVVNVPYMFSPDHSASSRRSNGGLFMVTDRPGSVVSDQDRFNAIAAAAAISKSGGQSTPVHRVYQNIKQNPDMMIPIQGAKTNGANAGIHGHKQFGMRGLFM
jgi:hypothetical protein